MQPRFARVRVQNDRLATAARAHRFDDHSHVPFLCECDDHACQAFVSLTLPEYAALRAVVYFAAPGHRIADGDRTGMTAGYDLYLVTRPQAVSE